MATIEIVRLGAPTLAFADHHAPHSAGRLHSVRAVARKKPRARQRLDKQEILRAYEDRLTPSLGAAAARAVDGGEKP